MQIKDNLNMRGEVLITGVDSSTGKTMTFVDDKNLIVLSGRQRLAELLLNGTGWKIDTIVLGSGGTAANNPTLPYAVDPTETDVKIRIIPDPILDTSTFLVDTTASPKLSFTLIIPETSYNDRGINELALMLALNGTQEAFAIKRFATITKSASLSLKIVWSIYL
jgi:hypothetical protein